MTKKIPSTDAEAQGFLFDWLTRVARAGLRCPSNVKISAALRANGFRIQPDSGSHLNALGQRGMIRVEVYGQNWRQVTILTGPHAGRETANHKGRRRPYLIMDANTRRVGT